MMRRTPILIAFALIALGCGSDPGSTVPPCRLTEVSVLSQIDVRMDHWQFNGPVGVTVCESDLPVIDDEARYRLADEFKRLIHDYNLQSLNLCRTEKPSDDWTDDDWSNFRREPIARLNRSLNRPVIKDVFCELVFTEYEIMFTEPGA